MCFENYYDFGDIYENIDKLYYSDGTLVPKKGFEHPENGIIKIFTEDKNPFIEITYANNKKNGVTKFYNKKTSKVCFQQFYVDNKLDGVCQQFREDGSVKGEETFVNGVKEGLERQYYPNGKVKIEIMYKNNKKNGFAKCFYESGNIQQEAQYINNKQEGTMREYYENGNLEYEVTFKNDNAIGWGIRYYEDGNIKWKSPHGRTKGKEIKYYPNGNIEFEIESSGEKRNGKYFDYYENGKIKAEGYYKNDEKEGISKYYYENGKLEAEYSYKKGKKDGDCKEFHNSGKLRKIKPYKNGKLHGKYKTYYKNGTLQYEGNFKNGLKNGISIYYNKNGDVDYKIPFNNGVLAIKKNDIGFKKDEEIVEDFKNIVITNDNDSKAVELKYDKKIKNAPFLVDKGVGKEAEQIIENANNKDLYISKNYFLVKKLYCLNKEEKIPSNLYSDVATVFATSDKEEKKIENFEKYIKEGTQIKKEDNIKKIKVSKNKENNSSMRLDLINCSRDIEFLTEKIITSNKKNFSICIYGDPGTGKSAYAKYLAYKLGLKIITKSAADLLDQYVGNGEKNIQESFEEAAKEKAMLVIDEVDSVLRSRDLAQRNWEVTLVNQMLTCMEHFNYPFVCTTNFIDTLDQASLRRFTFKLKFGFLKEDKIEPAFEHIFKMKPNKKILKMNGLTVSDFVNVKKECDILGIKDIDSISKMLDEIILLKESEELKSNIGFN